MQKLATKYILSDLQSNYNSRLLALNLFLLMYIPKLQDFMFTVACLKSPHEDFNILNFPKFRTYTTMSSSKSKLARQQVYYRRSRHFYFNHLPRLQNSFRSIDLEIPLSITYKTTYGIISIQNLTLTEVAHFITFVNVSVVVTSSTHPHLTIDACIQTV